MRVGAIAWLGLAGLLGIVAGGCNRGPAGATDDSSGEGETQSDTATMPDLPPDCGGAQLRLTGWPTTAMYVVDRSDASGYPFDHDGDPSTAMVTPAQRTDDAINALLEGFPNSDGCDNIFPGILISPGESSPGPGPAPTCTSDFEIIAPSPDSRAALMQRWASPPAPGGANPLRAALGSAVASATWEGMPEHLPPVLIVFWAGPAGCGDDSLAELLDAAVFDEVDPSQVIVVVTGPTTGFSPDATDGVPDGVDLAEYWASLPVELPALFMGADDGEALLSSLKNVLGPCGSVDNPDQRCTLSCDIDLSQAPNSPPDSPELVQEVIVNGQSFGQLPDEVTPAQCQSGQTDPGFIWIEPGTILTLCGDACEASIRCSLRPPWPDNGLAIDVPYACPTP